MPAHVIHRVEALALQDRQPLMNSGSPLFERGPGAAVPDLDDDDDPPGPPPLDDAPPQAPPVTDQRSADTGDPDEDISNPDDDIPDDDQSQGNDVDDNLSDDDEAPSHGDDDLSHDDPPNDDTETIDNPDMDDTPDPTPTTEERSVAPRYNLRGNRERSYDHRLDHRMDSADTNTKSYDAPDITPTDNPSDDAAFTQTDNFCMLQDAMDTYKESGSTKPLEWYITNFMFTQMSARKGIKKFGEVAVNALFSEFVQLNDKSVFDAIDERSLLTEEEKRGALEAISIIKEKRCGKIKGRTVANGRKQKGLYPKSASASPTVSLDALLLSLIIDTKENRCVSCADVAGAYLNADMDEKVLVTFIGEEVDIMCRVNPAYKKHILYEYKLFATTLEGIGFEINPYDPCVANKMDEGKQCTITWYVDDNKISHVNPTVVEGIVEKIEDKKMTIMRGNKHVFLGMNIELNGDGTVTLDMSEYVSEAIEDFQEEIQHEATTPAKKSLFEIDESSPKLNTAKHDNFHSIVAKLLYISKRARPDILLLVAFLCMRATKSTEQEDWTKLKRVLEYLKRYKDLTLTLGVDSLSNLHGYVDAAYGVHHDGKGHTGGMITFGRGALMTQSKKQQ